VRTPTPAVLLALAVLSASSSSCERFDNEGLDHCSQTIDSLFPLQGSNNVFGGAWIIADLTCPALAPTLSVQPPNGTPYSLAVETAHDGTQLRALPAVPLSPESRYIVHLGSGERSWDWFFVTNTLGNPLDYELAGHSEEFLLHQGEMVSPLGLAQGLQDHLHFVRPTLQFLAEPGALFVLGRLGLLLPDQDEQDLSWPTLDPQLPWQEQYFRVGPVDLHWPLQGWQLVLESVEIYGATHPVRGGTGRVNLEARWDTRTADMVLGDGSGSLCADSVEQGSGDCIPCHDGTVACLDLLLIDIPTQIWQGALDKVQ